MSKNFKSSEFACHCGVCGIDGTAIDLDFVDVLQRVRDEVKQAMKINSGCRCEDHNRRVGGKRSSYHTGRMGFKAADIHCIDPMFRARLVKAAITLGLTIGIARNFVHLDNRDMQIIFLY